MSHKSEWTKEVWKLFFTTKIDVSEVRPRNYQPLAMQHRCLVAGDTTLYAHTRGRTFPVDDARSTCSSESREGVSARIRRSASISLRLNKSSPCLGHCRKLICPGQTMLPHCTRFTPRPRKLIYTPHDTCEVLPCAKVSRTASTSSSFCRCCHGRSVATKSVISTVSSLFFGWKSREHSYTLIDFAVVCCGLL